MEAKQFKPIKVVRRLKQDSLNGKCYATFIICHLPCKIQIKHEKEKNSHLGLFYYAKYLDFTTSLKCFMELQLFNTIKWPLLYYELRKQRI